MDTKDRDIRIKFEVAPDRVELLKKHLSQKPALIEAPHHQSFSYTYLDTKDLALREEGFSLRYCEDGEPEFQLVAAPNGAAYRYFDEVVWQSAVEDQKTESGGFSADRLPSPLCDKISGTLRPVFRARTECRRNLIAHGGSEFEALIADGMISTENRSASYCEVQFRPNGGDPSDLFSYILGIDEFVPLRLGTQTDACRGYRLLRGKPVTAVKRQPIKLAGGLPSSDAFRIIAHSCLQHVVANEPAMSAGDAEALHQARIGLRRLRTALSLFSSVCSDTQVRTIRSEIKWLSELLGPARDLDVFLSEVMLPLREQYREEPGLLSLQRTYSALRTKVYGKVSQAANSVRFRSLILETAAWIETGLWAMNQSAETREARMRPIEIFAVNELNQRRKKVKKKGARISKLGPDERHALRIQVKKLRYSAEFFTSLFPAKKKTKRAFLSTLKDLQAALGDVNDIAVRAGLKSDVIAERKGRVDWQKQQHRAFAAGLIIGHQRARLESLIEMAEKSYSDFLQVKPFWHGFEPKTERVAENQYRLDLAEDGRADEAA